MDASITFYGAAGRVTGSNFLLAAGESKLLVDCGFIQGGADADKKNRATFSYDPSSVDALFITHAHLDHIGRVPKLVAEGFSGPIYSTAPTRDLAEVIFDDALSIMAEEERREGKEPLYSREDADKALALWETLEYGAEQSAAGFSAKLLDAGHILGSAMVVLTPSGGGESVVFTGDLGNSPAPLLRDTRELPRATYLVMESVYGDRNHENRSERRAVLKDAVETTIARGGTLLVPAFSVDRTQILLYELNNMIEDGEIKQVPVYLDSPLAQKATAIYKKYQHQFNESVKDEIKAGDDIFSFPGFEIVDAPEERAALAKHSGPKVIIAGSGMSTGGRILEHEGRYLPGKENMLLLTGFQAAGTLGRRLLEGQGHITIDDEKVPVRAEVRELRGYSAHKDSEHLIEFVAGAADSLKRVFLAMGEPKAAQFLAQRLHDYLDLDAVVPKEGESYDIQL